MIPLHLDPADMSPEACRARCLLHIHMSALNPKGWRKPPTARRRRKLRAPRTRLDNLAQLAALAGKAGLLERIKRKFA